MNGITGTSGQNGGVQPFTPAQTAELVATGFRMDPVNGIDQDKWIDLARNPKNAEIHEQFKELVELAGGRSDNGAIKEAMARVQAMRQAASPEATAADKQAALRGLDDQLTTSLERMDIKGQMTGPLQGATQALLSNPAYANTEWGKALQGAVDVQRNSAHFVLGLGQGIWEGGKSLVTGVVGLAGKALQFGTDLGPLGMAGDALRGLTGKLPGFVEPFIPSLERGVNNGQAIMKMGENVGNYVRNNSASDIAADIGSALDGAWEGLKAEHAAARAQGPDAEAQFWGKTIGRIGFEVGATFIPVAGVAGKVSTGARVTDAAVDGVRVADKMADGARVADGVADGERVVSKLDDVATKADNVSGNGRGPVVGAGNAAADATQLSGKLDFGSPAGAKGNPVNEAALAASGIRTITRQYGSNVVEWTVDAQGRLLSAKASLKEVFEGLKRGSDEAAAQTATAAKGIVGDHGGHAVGHRFLGDQGEINMFPQNGVPVGELKNFNGSAFKTLENELADWVSAGGKVDYEIKFSNFDPNFPDRPNTVSVEYMVRNSDGNIVHDRKRVFANEAGQTYNRLSKADIETKLASGQ